MFGNKKTDRQESQEQDVADDIAIFSAEAPVDSGSPPDFNHQPSVMSAGVTIKGTVTSPGPLHFQGSVEGEITAPQVTLGLTGQIRGKLRCDQLNVEGLVEGELICDELSAGQSARLEGSVRCKSLQLALGAVINGDVVIGQNAGD